MPSIIKSPRWSVNWGGDRVVRLLRRPVRGYSRGRYDELSCICLYACPVLNVRSALFGSASYLQKGGANRGTRTQGPEKGENAPEERSSPVPPFHRPGFFNDRVTLFPPSAPSPPPLPVRPSPRPSAGQGSSWHRARARCPGAASGTLRTRGSPLPFSRFPHRRGLP